MGKTPSGFSVEVVYCETCGEAAEGLPGSFTAEGLPEGWIAVEVSRYEPFSRDPDRPNDNRHVNSVYYCSASHLPADFVSVETLGLDGGT